MTPTNYLRVAAALAAAGALAGCPGPKGPTPPPHLEKVGAATQPAAAKPTAEEFVARVNRDLIDLNHEINAAGWMQSTDITVDTQYLNSRVTDRALAYYSRAAAEARGYEGQPMSPAAARSLMLIKLGVSAPAPADAAKRSELATLTTELEAMYGEGKYCPPKVNGRLETVLKFTPAQNGCMNLDELSEIIATSRNYDELTEAWAGWHTISRPMRAKYQRFAELANEGARELGFADLGVLWRSRYDMPAADFEKEAARLYGQVEPLYKSLHCYARGKLQKKYGKDKVPDGKLIPAQLFGNMWAQQWNRVFDDLLKPYPNASIETSDKQLKAQHWDAVRMTKSAESFYTSIGFPSLPPPFWERSMLTRPRDREVVCHASAWDMDDKDDVRIKMCIKPIEEDLFTVYHELGHVYYYLWYKDQPQLFQDGAHDGFHEAIGDTVNLSVTPDYLHRIGLVSAVKPSQEAVINQQMKMALDKVAFLPFGKMIDEWRWAVFDGRIKPADYNKAWWELRAKYQGVSPPVARSEQDFDPGAKYHIPGNTSYTRYFLSFILQFQFHKALCDAAGFKGPLHECSIFGNKEAGAKYGAMLALGASQPWPDTLQKLTGTRQMDASAIIEYFKPLEAWLAEQNQGQQCGWN
ncbi:MAG TPA: M2 family metallopeptidase [Steroidobacteraceae bacterium]|nr:M2 family metallopeptidase [Steroidobacteraceae bacterium]